MYARVLNAEEKRSITQIHKAIEKLGFKYDLIDSIPPERKQIWSPKRNSKVYRLQS